ncbi:MAG: hypothetical protein H7Y02_11145 [Candidatus Obscuribacterales bacterium]|nr:hypothetical protein [Steroidobacteraceae bacterium]
MHIIKFVHLCVGIFGIIVFVLTGQYLAIVLQGLVGMSDGPRLLYRTSHLYLMWSSLLNLVVGYYFVVAQTQGARVSQAISSAMLLLGPPLILIGFFVESPANNISRPFCGWANYFALAGTLLHVVSSRRVQPQSM